MVILYNIILMTGAVLGFPFLLVFLLLSPKRRKTVWQRLGLTPITIEMRSHGPIWIHALSVGEVIAVLPLLNKVKMVYAEYSIVLSVSTLKGYEVATQRIGDRVEAIVYYPYDFFFSVKRLISKISPSLVLIVETDIWPNFLFEMKRRNIPVILVNARFSDKSLAGYLRLLFFMKPVFQCFTKICAQTQADIQRFTRLGISRENITWTGNIKFEQMQESATVQEVNEIRYELNLEPNDRVFLAGSTHLGEEAIILEAYLQMISEWSNLNLIIAPRDPERAPRIRKDFEKAGLLAICKAELEAVTDRTRKRSVIVVDTIGVLSRLYALADVAFVGGSLVNSGGHNPLEPAAYGKPILFGPDMSDFKDISKNLLAAKGAIQVRDSDSIYRSVMSLLKDHKAAEQMGRNAYEVLRSNRGAVENTLRVIKDVTG